MDIFIPIFIFFTIFVLCSLCGFCCKNRNEGAIYSSKFTTTYPRLNWFCNTFYALCSCRLLLSTLIIIFSVSSYLLAPVVITSQTHQPVGAPTAYPVHTGGVQTSYHHTVVSSQIMQPSMPMPYNGSSAPYPTGPAHPMPGVASYPPAPYGQQATYPPTASPYPPQSTPYPQQSAPYPAQPDLNPPTYSDVVTNQSYQKQAPYNPNYTS